MDVNSYTLFEESSRSQTLEKGEYGLLILAISSLAIIIISLFGFNIVRKMHDVENDQLTPKNE